MASNIKFKRSAVQNRVPTTAQLDLGELALNTYDGKLYTEINTGSAAVVEIGSKLSSLVVDGANGGGGGDVVFHGTTSGYDLTWDYSDNSLNFADNAKLKVGTGGDLSIYHNGTNSYIEDSNGSAHLNVLSHRFQILNQAGNESMARFYANGAVELYHDNSLRVHTTADGADISGTGSLKIPVGTTAQRNSSPTNGDLRYNTTTGGFEGYSNNNWGELGAGGIGIGSDASNPRTGIIQNRVGVGFTDLNIVGAGISVTGYGTTVFVDFNEFKPGSFHRTIHNYTATAGQTTFAGLNYAVSEKQIAVYLNGARLSEATYTATSGTTVVLDVGASLDDEVEIINIHTNSDVDRKVNTYTATAGQTTFTGLSYNSKQELDVYLNGIRLASGDFTATSGSTVVLAVGASVDDTVDIVSTGDGVTWRSTTDASGDRFTLTNVGIGTDQTPDKLNVRGNVNVVGVLTATTLHGDGSNLTNTGSTLSEPSSGTQRLVTTSLTTGTMTSSGTGSELAFDYANNHLEFTDNTKATFGTSNDLEIFHDGGTLSYIRNNTGKLVLRSDTFQFGTQDGAHRYIDIPTDEQGVSLFYDNIKRFETTSAGVSVSGNIVVGTVTVSGGGVQIQDPDKFIAGTSDDLQLYHDGSNSYLTSSTGSFLIKNTSGDMLDLFSNGSARIRVNAGELAVVCNHNSSVDLYHNNIKKLETTAYGVNVTGTTDTDGLVVSGVSTFSGQSNFNQDVFFLGASSKTITFDQSEGHIRYLDNAKAQFGTQGDLEIYHNGSHAIIENTGDGYLFLNNTNANIYLRPNSGEDGIIVKTNSSVELYHNGSKKFETTSTGASITGNLAVSGVLTYEDVTSIDAVGIVTAQQGIHVTSGNIEMQTAGNIVLGDSGGTSDDRIVCGASSDLQIYHDPASGGSSFIDVTGSLQIHTSQLYINNQANSERLLRCTQDGSVELYHNGSMKLETDNSGVSITGRLDTTTGVRINADNQNLTIGAGDDLKLFHNGTNSTIRNITGQLQLRSDSITLENNDGSDFGTVTGIKFGDNNKAFFGAGNDLQIYSNGTAGYIDHVTTGTGADLILRSKTFVVRNLSDENMIVGNQNGAVNLYHDNTLTFSTTSFGSQTVFSSTNGDVDIFKVLHGNLSQGIGIGYNTISAIGSNTNVGLGLRSQGSSNVAIITSYGENMAVFTPEGAANLYYNNTLTTRTTSYGAEINFSSSGGNIPILKVVHGNATQGVGIGYDSIVSTGSNTNIPLNIRSKGSSNIQISTSTEEIMARFTPNGATELYHDGTKRIETTANGVLCLRYAFDTDNYITCNNTANTMEFVLGGSDIGEFSASGLMLRDNMQLRLGTGNDLRIYHTGSETHIKGTGAHGLIISTNNSERWGFESGGHFKPHANNAYDLGHSSYRIRNIYVNDLQLSNEAKKDTGGNDVDGTWGDWTLQEGEEEVFMINNRTGKKYAMMLREVK